MKKSSYSTLVNGKIIWVHPDDKPLARDPIKRSRLETDQEVRARLKANWPDMYRNMIGDESAQELDQILKFLGSSRQMKDE